MAKLTCTLKEFTYFIDPRIRNNVASMTKQSITERNYICMHCRKKRN